MICIDIPGVQTLELSHLVLDYNGTLGCDGKLIEGVSSSLIHLAANIQVHVVTADTYGTVRSKLEGLPVCVDIIGSENQDVAKDEYVKELGSPSVVAMGNGYNDRLMLKRASLGIGLLQAEGAAVAALLGADVICTSIVDALDLLINSARLKATLRN